MTTGAPGPLPGRAVLDAIDEPAAVRDEQGRLLDANAAFVQALAAEGASREDVLDHERRADAVDESVLELIEQVRPGARLRLTDAAVWRAGTSAHLRVDLTATPLDAPKGATLLRFLPRGAEARALSNAERDSRRATVGAIAAGLAHDINNQLAASMNIAALLQDDLGAESSHGEALEILVGASREAAELSRRLLRLVGRGEAALSEVALGPLVEDVVLLLRHELPPSERSEVRVADDVPVIVGDSSRLEHLVALLVLPCADAAAGDDGALTVTVARHDEGAELEVRVRGGAPLGDDAAFDLAKTIVEHHGGTFEVEPTDDGTTLRARLTAGELPPPPVEEAAPAEASAGLGRVLVVDDDAMVRNVALAMIRRLGYDVVAAAGGEEALRCIDEDPDISLVLLDLVMEDVGGVQALQEIRRRKPGLLVLISSGFVGKIGGGLPDDVSVDGVLEKPYSLAMLRNALESRLG